jgi:flagella synthesis protein FlgN
MNKLLHDSPSLHAIWDEALEWAKQANILNCVNGYLINVRLSHNRHALSVMHQTANSPTTYGQDGLMLHAAQGRAIGVG